MGQIELCSAAGAAGLPQRIGQAPVDLLAVGEDENAALPVKGFYVSMEGRRLCRVKRFHDVNVAIVGLLDAAVVAELAPCDDFAQIRIVVDIPGADLLDKSVVCRMPCHLRVLLRCVGPC